MKKGIQMDLLKLESHIFMKDMKDVSTDDMSRLISLFKDEELLPQYFEESGVNQQRNRRLMFINPLSGKSVRFQNDRVVVSVDCNPFEETSCNGVEMIPSFIDFVAGILGKMGEIIQDDFKSHRISLVTNAVNILEEGEKESLSNKVLQPLPWISGDGYTELKLKLGELHHFESINETGNVVLSMDDGKIEQKKNGQFAFIKDCYLSIWDLNTDIKNSHSRFQVVNSEDLLREMAKLTMEKIKKFNTIFS